MFKASGGANKSGLDAMQNVQALSYMLAQRRAGDAGRRDY